LKLTFQNKMILRCINNYKFFFLFHSVNYLSLLLSRCNTNSVGHGLSVARYYETTCVYQLNSCARARVRLWWWARRVSATSTEDRPWAQFHQRSVYCFYACRSQKRKKRQPSWQCCLALLGPTNVKAACKTLVKLTSGLNFINILRIALCL